MSFEKGNKYMQRSNWTNIQLNKTVNNKRLLVQFYNHKQCVYGPIVNVNDTFDSYVENKQHELLKNFEYTEIIQVNNEKYTMKVDYMSL